MPRKRTHTRRKPKGNPCGTLSVSSAGFGFVQTAEGEYFVPAAKMNGAFDGDLVEVAPLPRDYYQRTMAKDDQANQKPACRIVNVVQRAHDSVIGRYEIAEPFGVVVPEDPRLTYDIFTRHEDNPDVPDGAIVSVRVTAFPTRSTAATGVIEEVLGDADDERVPIDLIVARCKLETLFSESAQKEAEDARLDEVDALNKGYRDLRDRFVFTVDPTDAKDFDDAVSLEPHVRGHACWRLGVHIADVGYYVPWNSSIDLEARRRSTSVYLVDRVIPMLPEQLSNDLCSLRPNETRRSMTVDMFLDDRGFVVDADVYPALIRSNARLSYNQALALLKSEEDNGQTANMKIIGDAALSDLAQRLRGLSRIAKQRAQKRRDAGGIDFDTVEARVALDGDGAPQRIDIRRKNDATELIEEAMILANETVARFLRDRGFPCLYRVHEKPTCDNLEGLLPILREYPWFKQINEAQFIVGEPHTLASVIDRSKGRPEHEVVASLLLRAMMRAVYAPECSAHFGLASEAYCHFTSPIRRYPDLVVHRMLKAALGGRPERFDQEVSNLSWIAEHASKMERIAETASRESHVAKIVELMEGHIGETFEALVAGVASYGIFVRLDNTAEGLVRIEDLGREYFYLDAARHRLVGSDSGHVYRLGQRLEVVLTAADRRTRRLDFRPYTKRDKKKAAREQSKSAVMTGLGENERGAEQ